MTDPIGRGLSWLERQASWGAPLLLRMAVGSTFIAHGYGKIFERGILATADGFAQMGVPMGQALGPVVPVAEFFGGIAVVLGLGTRAWAFLQAWIMAFAIAFVHGSQGFKMHGEIMSRGGKEMPVSAGWEWQALLLAACLALVLMGPGRASIDAWVRRRFRREMTP